MSSVHGPNKRHIDRDYERELGELRERLLRMAGVVESMIADAVRAYMTRDTALARRTIDVDPQVNRAEVEADALCLQILARRQPMAGDLRFVTLALKMVTDLERIADLAVSVAHRALALADMDAPPPPHPDMERIAELAGAMVREAIDAFVRRDAARARAVLERDDEVDDLYHGLFRDLLAEMRGHRTTIDAGILVQAAAKFLERIADHATNLAEEVIFFVDGTDVRHRGKR